MQFVQRSSGQIQLRIARMPVSRSFRPSPLLPGNGVVVVDDDVAVVVVGWNGLSLLLLPFLALRLVGDEKETRKE